MTACRFCAIAQKELPEHIVYEDADVIAFLDRAPVHPGHTLVIPKRHSDDVSQMDPVDLQAVTSAAQRVLRALLLEYPGGNIITNVRVAGGQSVFHTHFHVIPRFSGDHLDIPSPQPAYEKGQDVVWTEKLRGALNQRESL